MKPFFRSYILKILFLLFVTNTEIRPAAIVPAVMATEELAALAVMSTAAIHEMLIQYRQLNKSKDEILLVNVPETSIPIQSISVTGKLDEEVVANDPECYLGPDKRGHHWYAKILKNGKQVYAEVRSNIMESWGINEPGNIRTYNSETGLKALKYPSQKIPRKPL